MIYQAWVIILSIIVAEYEQSQDQLLRYNPEELCSIFSTRQLTLKHYLQTL
jgi:hypothetical protein